MKKILLILVVSVVFSLVLIACSNGTASLNLTTTINPPSTTTSIENTITNETTVTHDNNSEFNFSSYISYLNRFVDNHILLSINHEDSLKFIEYTIEDFIIEDILEIRDLTEGYKSIIANDPTYDSSKFRRIFLLIMDYHDCDRILEDIERLNELLDFIEGTAGVDGYSIPASSSNQRDPNR